MNTLLTPKRSAFKWIWPPLLMTAAAECLLIIPWNWNTRWIGLSSIWIVLAGWGWFLGLAVLRFCQKRTAAGFGSLGLIVLLIALFIPLNIVGFILGLSSSSEDGFADELSLPQGLTLIEAIEPPEDDKAPGFPEDTFQAAIRKQLSSPVSSDLRPDLHLPSLEQLRKDHPALLDRYLAAHPGWRVYNEKGGRYATRRWMVGPEWTMPLHGYYSSFSREAGPQFQTRTTLAFSGKTWAKHLPKVSVDHPETIKTEISNGMWESYIAVPIDDLLIEQMEESETQMRPITKAAFAELEKEFAAVLRQPDWARACKLLPPSAILTGPSSIELIRSFQGGLYNARVRCNPGEPGRVYLKAFEITRDYRLSGDRLEIATNEWLGWSDDPAEQFLSETHFTIYEGDWDQFYGARFEVWFQPDRGGPERKLIEQNFKIEGWMR